MNAARLALLAALATPLLACGGAEVVPASPIGATQLGAIPVQTPNGAPTTLGARAGDGLALLIFMTEWCEVCQNEQPDYEVWARNNPAVRAILIVSGSPAGAVRELADARGIDRGALDVIVDADGAVADGLAIDRTPTLILWDGGQTRGRWHRVRDVRVRAAADAEPRPATPNAGDAPRERVAVEDHGRELGTSWDVVVVADATEAQRASDDIAVARARCRALEAQLSEWRADSEISRLNARGGSEVFPLSRELRDILVGARAASEWADGAFDVTWRPLGALWDDAGRRGEPPTDAAIAKALDAVGFRHLRLDDAGARFLRPGVQLGIAGVAKGYIIDAVWRTLRDRGWDDVVVNIGGDLRTSGRGVDGAQRRFVITDPWSPERAIASFTAENVAVATSGNYIRGRDVGGARIGHILDPRTGRPPAFEGSVTVLTRDAAMADALATALFVLGPELGEPRVRAVEGLDAIWVGRDGVRATLPLDDEAAP